MKHFLKGIAALAMVLAISMIIHVFCNMKGVQLNTSTTAVVSASFAILIYHILTRNEKNKDDPE